jgi:hypothetical protein
VDVAFMPTDQTFYGMNIPREITPKATTRLEYSNNLANPETVPPDEGYGAGLIRITNNSTGVVVAVDIWDKADLNTSLSMGYENFTPPIPIQYGRVGRVPVVGTPAFPLNPGPNHIIQVTVETPAGLSVVERLAALRGAIVDIVITEDMFQDTSRTGSKVTVYNTTTHPTTIIGMEVYSKDPAITGTAVYNLGIPSPAGSQSLYVLSGSTLPILEGQHYKAQLTVFGNGNIAQIDKEFSPGDDLYSLTPDDHPRTITLVEADLPPELKETIVPLQSVTVVPNPYTLWSTTQSALDLSGMTLKTGGTLDLNTDMVVVYNPNDASKKQPIVWSVQSGGSYVNLNAGILTVTGIAPVGSRAITVRAAIADAGVNQASVYGDFTVNLMYNNEISTKKVTGIILTPATVQAGDTISLPGLAVLNPAGANINGVQITVDSLIWTVVSGGTGAGSISGSTFTAGTNGKVNVRATLPAAANDGTLVTADMIITVTAVPPPFVPITAVTWVNGSLRLPFATVTAPNGTTRTLSASPTPTLTLSKDSLSFNPATASKQEPITWELVSGGTASTGGFTLSGTNLSIKNQNPLPADIADGKTVNIKLSIPGSLNSNGTYTVTLPVTLVEYNSRPVAASGELSVANASIALNATIDLNTLVTLPAAYINTNGVTVPITAADLIWSLPSGPGTGNGTLSGSNFTGTLSGAVGVLATLPAAKNNGVEVVAAGIITVETPPPPPPAHPASLTFRIFKTNNSDYVREIALLPVSVSDDAGYPASLISLIRQTGHSNYAWANRTPDPTYRSNFVNWLSPYGLQLKGIVKLDSTGDYADVTIPWPTGSTVGYNLFFIEGDSRVRGYVRPAKLDPPKASNYVFYLNFDTVKNYIIPMKGAYEAAPGTAGAVNVVGIAYNSHDNNAAILKSAGVGKIPNYDLRYPF